MRSRVYAKSGLIKWIKVYRFANSINTFLSDTAIVIVSVENFLLKKTILVLIKIFYLQKMACSDTKITGMKAVKINNYTIIKDELEFSQGAILLMKCKRN